MYRKEFIDKLKDSTVKGWHEHKVLPSLTIAQAILETGWGKGSIGNNLFGIKADKNWNGKKKLVKTHEYVNGVKIYVNAYFRDYNSIYESLEDRYKFLKNKRYSKVVGQQDYKIACHEIYKAGYATDPKYPSKLISLIEQYKLYEIDKIALSTKTSSTPSSWALDSWNWAKMKSYIDGTRPLDKITREELALVLMRVFKGGN